ARLHGDVQRTARSEQHLELDERNERELILRPSEERSFLRADADDTEVGPLDLYDLVQRIDFGAEEPVGRLPPDYGDRARRLDFGRRHETAALGAEARETGVIRRHALNARIRD